LRLGVAPCGTLPRIDCSWARVWGPAS
jgi:hypothetical protein